MEETLNGGDDLFGALGDSFQLADDGNLSVGSFDNHDQLDFSSELVFGVEDVVNVKPTTSTTTTTPEEENDTNAAVVALGGSNSSLAMNHQHHHHQQQQQHGSSVSSLQDSGTHLSAALQPPPTLPRSSAGGQMSHSSFNNSMNTSFGNSSLNAFRGPSTATSSSALQNAASSLQASSAASTPFAFNNTQRQQQQQQDPPSQSMSMQNAFNRPQNPFQQPASRNPFLSSNSMTSLGRSSSVGGNPMNRSSLTSSGNTNNSNSMGNATFNNVMPPPTSRSTMTTPSISSSGSSNSMFKSFLNSSSSSSNFFSRQPQTQQTNTSSASSAWNNNNANELEKPKRPLSAYEFFVQERKRLGVLTDAQLQLIWKEQLDGRQKAIYLQQARADRQRYISELKLWKARTDRQQPVGAVGSFLKARLQGSKTDLLVEANKRGRLQPAIVSCPNLNASPSVRLQAMQQQQQFQGGGLQQNATFDNFPQGGGNNRQARPRSRFVANQMQRLQQGQGLANLASELGDDCTTAFVSAMMPRSQSASVVSSSSSSSSGGLRRFANKSQQQRSTPDMQDPLLDPLIEFPGF